MPYLSSKSDWNPITLSSKKLIIPDSTSPIHKWIKIGFTDSNKNIQITFNNSINLRFPWDFLWNQDPCWDTENILFGLSKRVVIVTSQKLSSARSNSKRRLNALCFCKCWNAISSYDGGDAIKQDFPSSSIGSRYCHGIDPTW